MCRPFKRAVRRWAQSVHDPHFRVTHVNTSGRHHVGEPSGMLDDVSNARELPNDREEKNSSFEIFVLDASRSVNDAS